MSFVGLAAVLELGCLFGVLGTGVFADRISRRTSIASACGECVVFLSFFYFAIRSSYPLSDKKAVFCAGSALQTWARSLTQLTSGRAIGGIGVGALR